MAKKKYFYNEDTCTYEPIKVRQSDIAFGSIAFGVVVLLFAIILTFAFNTYFDTESEAKLKKENQALSVHLASIKKEQQEIDQMLNILQKRDQLIYQAIYENSEENKTLTPKSTLGSFSDNISESGLTKETADEFRKIITDINNLAIGDLSELGKTAQNRLENIDALQYIPTMQPIANPELDLLVSGFGKRMNPFHHGIMDHHGIDFTAPIDAKVFATGKGTVKSVIISDANTGYGNRIDIDHGNGLVSRYTHLNTINVKKGQEINKGETIATVGNSGGTIAPSLHYEILRDDKRVNPVNFFIQGISEKDFIKLFELASRQNQSLD